MRMSLMTAEPSLARRLPRAELESARESVTIARMSVPVGEWNPPREPHPRHLGFLMLEGLILRDVCVARDWSSEILSRGDLLRPWLEDSASFVAARWQVLEEVEFAVLDPAATVQIGRFPDLVDELVDRAMRRSRAMAVHALIEGVHRIDERILLLFWHLAEQHGKRVDGQIEVPLRLSHSHLSRLVGARRPTVTTALGALAGEGKLIRLDDGGWAVRGEPPVPGSLADGNDT
jgi:hypothetical protein